MADELSDLNFADDLAEVSQVAETTRWKIEKGGALEIYVDISSAKEPREIFQARLLWNSYPGEEPPSLKFRDPATGRLDMPTAWPVVRGFRPANLDACVNWCAEGFATHPEWRNDANLRWQHTGNCILRVLRILQRELDEHFTGRFKQ